MKRIPKWAWIVLGVLLVGGVCYALFGPRVKVIIHSRSSGVDSAEPIKPR